MIEQVIFAIGLIRYIIRIWTLSWITLAVHYKIYITKGIDYLYYLEFKFADNKALRESAFVSNRSFSFLNTF